MFRKVFFFFELRAQVKAFMESDAAAIPALSDSKCLMDLAFPVDIMKPECTDQEVTKGQLLSAAFDNLRAFSAKPVL